MEKIILVLIPEESKEKLEELANQKQIPLYDLCAQILLAHINKKELRHEQLRIKV